MPTLTRKSAKKKARKPTKNIMLNKRRYFLIVHDAKAAGYQVSRGPMSQLGTFLEDASHFYSQHKLKTRQLALKSKAGKAKTTPKDPPRVDKRNM